MLIYQLKHETPQLLPITQALGMMASIASVVNSKADDGGFWKDDIGALNMITPTIGHLLSIPRLPADASQLSDALFVGEMARLACLMILSGLRERFRLNTSDMLPLRRKFSALVMLDLTKSNGNLLGLRLWALITAALLQPSESRAGLLPYIQSALRGNGMTSLSPRDAIDYARALLWIETLQAHEAVALEQQVFAAPTGISNKTA